jgi:hypothetical protein
MSEASSGERVRVVTYVPDHQKRQWEQRAQELDMSTSEYVRTMAQAGSRGFDEQTAVETGSTDATPGDDGLESRVLDALHEAEHLSWEELLATVTDDVEQRLEETLDSLQSDNRVKYSGRDGGYVLDE